MPQITDPAGGLDWTAGWAGLVTDTSGDLAAHLALQEQYAAGLGPLAVTDDALPGLGGADRGAGARGPLVIDLVVTGGAGAIGPALTWAARADGVRLAGLSLTLRDEADLAHNAQRVLAALDEASAGAPGFPDDLPVHVLLPSRGGPTATVLGALDELAASWLDLRLDVAAGTFADLADAALDRELALRCRDTDPLSALLATRACLDGGDIGEALCVPDPATGVRALGPEVTARTRRWCTGVTSASPAAVLRSLAESDLLVHR